MMNHIPSANDHQQLPHSRYGRSVIGTGHLGKTHGTGKSCLQANLRTVVMTCESETPLEPMDGIYSSVCVCTLLYRVLAVCLNEQPR